MGQVLSTTFDKSNDSDAIYLARAAQIVRRDMFDKLFSFEGSFELNCHKKSVPSTLITLTRLLLEGPNIARQTDSPVHSEALTIAQLIRHNSIKHQRRKSPSTTIRHGQTRKHLCHFT